MSVSKIQTGDKVKIIAGKYKNTTGTVTQVRTKTVRGLIKKRVAVSSVPKINKFRKAFTFQGESYPGSVTLVPRFIDISNVSLIDENGKVTKSKVVLKDGKKIRVYKSTQSPVLQERIQKPRKAQDNEHQLETKAIK